MTAEELAAWLDEHGHTDIEVRSFDRVSSVNRAGRLRVYVLANDTVRELVGGDYWRIDRARR